MVLILDEWLFHDLGNDNGKERQKETFYFLLKIKERDDKIVLIKNSKHWRKFWSFPERFFKNLEIKKKMKVLKNSFFLDSNKTLIIEELDDSHYLGDNINIFKDMNPDDYYLLSAYIKVKDDGLNPIIITTDNKLKQTLEKHQLNIEFRDEFIKNYMAQ